ncbi:hypothetical protein NliqN6_6691 [Naganishia liquefaciens]|uniref:Alpha/beta hydrolase fold-3 domain-containing protein n=1 Tax=Naganishia liquefaciens TaxID=104408 RepID=A0A8H3U1W7_9TREE|nr:hypothetical protein NliqN6_6691 [Naganishia liquefaciens]
MSFPAPSHRILFKPIPNSETGGCHMDVYLPEVSENAPIAWMIHGGGFTIGGSHHIPVDQVQWFLDHGVAVVSNEYRLLPHASMDDIREDNLDAYKWILDSLNSTIGVRLDISKIAILGWSAGGTALFYLTHDAHQAGLPGPTCLIPTYPKVDMKDPAEQPISALKETCSKDEWEAVERLRTGPVCTGYKHGITWYLDDPSPRATWMKVVRTMQTVYNPLPKLIDFPQSMRSKTIHASWFCADPPFPANVSPINLLSSTFPPTFVVIATADWLIPPAESHALVEKLKGLGVEVTHAEAQGMGHGVCEDPRSSWPEGQNWWVEAVQPSLEWAREKLLA